MQVINFPRPVRNMILRYSLLLTRGVAETPNAHRQEIAMPTMSIQPQIETRALPIPRDLKHVSLKEHMEEQYWSRRFQTSRRQLEEAVERVGHSVNAVADYIDRNR